MATMFLSPQLTLSHAFLLVRFMLLGIWSLEHTKSLRCRDSMLRLEPHQTLDDPKERLQSVVVDLLLKYLLQF